MFLITASHCGHVRHFNKREEKVNVLSKGKTLFYLFICIYLLERVIERMRAKDLFSHWFTSQMAGTAQLSKTEGRSRELL